MSRKIIAMPGMAILTISAAGLFAACTGITFTPGMEVVATLAGFGFAIRWG